MAEEQTDDAFLDRVFDLAVRNWSEGRDTPLDGLVAGREHLRDEAAEMVRLARDVAVGGPLELPRFAGYEILRELGRGGMGTVLLARHLELDRPVAIKVLSHGARFSASARARFRNEARALARVRHPNVVGVHEVVEADDALAYAMEYVEGPSLADRLRSGDALALRRACELAAEVGRALEAVHGAGLLHRDVKPSNVLVRGDGTALLSDFGLARDQGAAGATVSGEFVGTAAYASPEQLRGDWHAIDARADVYGLGATLHELVTGRPPYAGSSPAEILRRLEDGVRPPLPGEVPREIATVLAVAMDPSPARRYASAAALADDLERWLEGHPILARPPSAAYRFRKLVARHRLAFALIALLGVVLVAFAGSMAALALRLAEQRGELAEQADEIRTQSDLVRDEAVRNARVLAFFQEHLGAADPFDGAHRERTVLEMIERMEREVGPRFADLPRTECAVRATLGRILTNCDRPVLAEAQHRRVLELLRSIHPGADHPMLASAMRRQALALEVLDRPAEAEALLVEALAMARRLDDPTGARVASALRQLGELRHRRGKTAEGRAMMREAVAWVERAIEPDREELADALSDLARALAEQGEKAEAIELYRRSLALHLEVRGADDLATAGVRRSLGIELYFVGELDAAEEELREARDVARAFATDSPIAQHASFRLGSVLVDRGEYGEALEAVRVADGIARRNFGDDHPWTIPYGHVLVMLLELAGEWADVERLAQHLVVLEPAGSAGLASALGYLGRARMSLGRPDEGADLIREGAAIWRSLGEEGDAAYQDLWVADYLIWSGELEEAEVLLEGAYAVFTAEGHPGDPRLERATATLAGLYERTGRVAEAAALRADG